MQCPTTLNVILSYMELDELLPFFLTHKIPLTTQFIHSQIIFCERHYTSIIPQIINNFPSIILTTIQKSIMSHIHSSKYKYIKEIIYDTNEHTDLIDMCTNLKHVLLHNYDGPHNLHALNHITSIKTLNMLGFTIAKSLPTPHPPNLRYLYVKQQHIPRMLSDLNATHTKLHCLHISNNIYQYMYKRPSQIYTNANTNINNFYIKKLRNLTILLPFPIHGTPQPSQHLKKLTLSRANIHLLSYYPSITHLTLHFVNLKIFPTDHQFRHLKYIKLYHCFNSFASKIHHLFPNIEHMSLNSSTILEFNFKKLKLKKLRIIDKDIINKGITHLLTLKSCPNIKHITINGIIIHK